MGRMSLLGAGHNFSLTSYLASVSGSYWDFTKTDDQFQENTGPTPAIATNDPIGLKLDRALWGGKTLAQVIAAATELVTNGSFSGTTGWTGSNATLSAAGGVLTVTATTNGTAARAQQTISGLVAGNIYKLSLSIRKPNGTTPSVGAFVSGATGGSTPYTTSSVAVPTVIYFVATSASHVLNLDLSASGLVAGVTAEFSGVSVKLISGIPAIQSSGSAKPTWQSTGSKFDGSDDNLLTSYLAGASSNFIVALVTVPATLSAGQIVAGANDASSANRCYLSFNTDGTLGGGVGTQNPGTIKGSSDFRSQTVVVGLTISGALVRLFGDAAVAYEAAQSGNPTTATAFRLGGLNNNGTASSFFGGSIKRIAAGKDFLTLARYQQIRSALLAA